MARSELKRRFIVSFWVIVPLLSAWAGVGRLAANPVTAPSTRPAPPTSVPATEPTILLQIAPAPAPQVQSNLLAHGSGNNFWMAHVLLTPAQSPPEHTRIDFRSAEGEWQPLIDLPTRVTGLANSGSQLAVLLDDGEWKLLSEDGTGATGQPLPGGAKMLALANDGETLWAIGTAPPLPGTAPAATTQSASISTATQPAAMPSSGNLPRARVAIYTLGANGWRVADGQALPADVHADAPLSLAIIDHIPWLAVARPGDTVQVLHRGAGPGGPWLRRCLRRRWH